MIKIINSQIGYWFKRDIQTIKKGLRETARKSLLIFIIVFILIILGSYLAYSTLNVVAIAFYFMATFPTALAAYFLCYLMKNKGYKITHYPPDAFSYRSITIAWYTTLIGGAIYVIMTIIDYLFYR